MNRLLVCGGRHFNDYELMKDTLARIVAVHGFPSVVINGGMAGADALSSYWAYENKINTICVGARWGDYGSKAGPRRNRAMLDWEPTLVVAFYDRPRTSSRGTSHMVSIAKAAGIEVIEVGGE